MDHWTVFNLHQKKELQRASKSSEAEETSKVISLLFSAAVLIF